MKKHKSLSIKDNRSQGGVGRSCSVRTRGFFRWEDHTFFAKTLEFSKFMVCLHGRGRESQFSRFCADVFYGRPLTVMPNWEWPKHCTNNFYKSCYSKL